MKNPLVVFGGLVVLAIGFVMGAAAMRWLLPERAVVVEYKDVPKAVRADGPDVLPATADTLPGQPPEAAPGPVIAETREEQALPGEVEFEELDGNIDADSPLDRARRAVALAESVTPENLENVLKELDELDGQERFLAMHLVVAEWGKFDPQGAFAYVQAQGGNRMAAWIGADALAPWVREDPVAALAYASDHSSGRSQRFLLSRMASSLDPTNWGAVEAIAAALPQGEQRQAIYDGVLRNLADTDPAAAFQLYLSLDEADRSNRALSAIVRAQVSSDADAAMNNALTVSDPALREQLVREVGEEWARHNPKSAAAWLQRNSQMPGAASVAREVGEELAEQDPAAAVQWAQSLPSGEVSRQALARAVSEWANADPDAAGEWLNAQKPSADLDPAVESFARHAARIDPEGAMEWAQSLTQESMRKATTLDLAKYWAAKDPAAANAWLESSDLSDEEKEQVQAIQPGERMRPPWAGH